MELIALAFRQLTGGCSEEYRRAQDHDLHSEDFAEHAENRHKDVFYDTLKTIVIMRVEAV